MNIICPRGASLGSCSNNGQADYRNYWGSPMNRFRTRDLRLSLWWISPRKNRKIRKTDGSYESPCRHLLSNLISFLPLFFVPDLYLVHKTENNFYQSCEYLITLESSQFITTMRLFHHSVTTLNSLRLIFRVPWDENCNENWRNRDFSGYYY